LPHVLPARSTYFALAGQPGRHNNGLAGAASTGPTTRLLALGVDQITDDWDVLFFTESTGNWKRTASSRNFPVGADSIISAPGSVTAFTPHTTRYSKHRLDLNGKIGDLMPSIPAVT